MKLIYALCGLLLANASWAAPDLAVDAIKMPAWLVHGAQRQPLAVGTALRSGDVLLTGNGARVRLRAADGSDMRLGGNAQLDLSGIGRKHHDRPKFSAQLVLVKGAFRYTTQPGGSLHEREVSVHVAGVDVATQGADLWCRATGSGSGMVLLKSGTAMMAHGTTLYEMDRPLMSYVMTGGTPVPLSDVSPERFRKLAQETAMGVGSVRRGGRWKVNLEELKGEKATLAAYDRLRAAGYDVRILPLHAGKYRLHIIRLANRDAAEAVAGELRGKLGVRAPHVSR